MACRHAASFSAGSAALWLQPYRSEISVQRLPACTALIALASAAACLQRIFVIVAHLVLLHLTLPVHAAAAV